MKVDTHGSLKIEVWDDDWHSDDLLGSCTRTLKQGNHKDRCSFGSSGVEFKYTLTCNSHLIGDMCEKYKPSA